MSVPFGRMGLASSLGVSAAGACAAARAGLSRAREIDFEVVDDETQDTETVVGHEIGRLTRGFEGDARLLRIAELAWSDLERTGPSTSAGPGRLGLILCLPDRSSLHAAGPDEDGPAGPLPLSDEAFLAAFLSRTGAPIGRDQCLVVRRGHGSVLLAVHHAMSLIGEGRWEECVVGAVDSLLDPLVLTDMRNRLRLKCADSPAGIQPGEAGVFLVVGGAGDAGPDGDGALTLAASSVASDPDAISGEDPRGLGFAEVARGLKARLGAPEGVSMYVDQNGEMRRALDWGHALVHCHQAFPELTEAELRLPATSFGDTGVSSGGISLCMAAHELRRRPRTGPLALALSASDDGDRAGVALRRA